MTQFEKFISLLASKTPGWTKDSLTKKLLDCGDPDEKKYKPKSQPGRDQDLVKRTRAEHGDQVTSGAAEPWKSAKVRFQLAQERRKEFVKLFKAYAKVGDRRNNGFVMSKHNAMMWFRHANIVGSSINEDSFHDCFRNVVQTKLEVNAEEMRCVIIGVGRIVAKKPDEIMTMLLSCGGLSQTHSLNDSLSEAPSVQDIKTKTTASELQCPGSNTEHFNYGAGFEELFKMYSKLGSKARAGIIISKLNTLIWFQQAGLLEESDSHLCVLDSFQQVARTQTVINKSEFEKFLKIYSSRKFRSCQDLVKKLVCCGKPDFTNIKKKKVDLMRKASSFRDVSNSGLQTSPRRINPRFTPRSEKNQLQKSRSLHFKN